MLNIDGSRINNFFFPDALHILMQSMHQLTSSSCSEFCLNWRLQYTFSKISFQHFSYMNRVSRMSEKWPVIHISPISSWTTQSQKLIYETQHSTPHQILHQIWQFFQHLTDCRLFSLSLTSLTAWLNSNFFASLPISEVTAFLMWLLQFLVWFLFLSWAYTSCSSEYTQSRPVFGYETYLLRI